VVIAVGTFGEILEFLVGTVKGESTEEVNNFSAFGGDRGELFVVTEKDHNFVVVDGRL